MPKELPQVLNFDPRKVKIDPNAKIVTKITTLQEYENTLAAADFLDNAAITLTSGHTLKTAPVLGFDDRNNHLHLSYSDGYNFETHLRNIRSETQRLAAAEFMQGFIRSAVTRGFGWGDIAPRNILIEDAHVVVVDFEKPLRLSDTTSDYWARNLHGYALEELSCLFPLEYIDYILGNHADASLEPSRIPKSLITSRRKLAILKRLLSDREFNSDTLPTKTVREVERLMACVAQPTLSRQGLKVTMDHIEAMVRMRGIEWYADLALSKQGAAHVKTSAARKSPVAATSKASPSGFNTITITPKMGGEVINCHLAKPGVDVLLPAREGVYLPKSATDIAAVLTDNYADTIKGRHALELGCGDHAVLAHCLYALGAQRVVASDIDPKATQIVTQYGNLGIAVRQSDIFSSFEGKKFDLIVFNAPQMPMPDTDRRTLTDWHDSPGSKGYEVILQTLQTAPGHLAADGRLVCMVFDFLMTDGKIAETAQKAGFETTTIGSLIQPVRSGGQTEKMLPYIQKIFPKMRVFQNSDGNSHITASVLEFKLIKP